MSCFLVKFLYIYSFSSFFLYNPLFQVIHGRIFCLLHRENHSPLPINNSYPLSHRLPVPAILQKPATTAPVYIFGRMPMPPTDGAERRMPTVYRHWSTKNGTESELRKNGSHWITAFYPGSLYLRRHFRRTIPCKIIYLGSQIQGNGIYWPYGSQKKAKAKRIPYEETQA